MKPQLIRVILMTYRTPRLVQNTLPRYSSGYARLRVLLEITIWYRPSICLDKKT